jgi:micrococcal nuclease
MRIARLPLLAGLAAAAALGGCAAETGDGPTADAAQIGAREPARVVRVVDGDTLKVRLGDGRRRTVRVLGIDTPETKKPGTPVECGGPQATASMARLALQGSGYAARGREVVLISDPTEDQVDRYGRILAYVEAGGRDLGERQIASGWAEMYAYRDRRFQRRARYERAERAARDQRRGVWGACGGDFHSAR